MNKKSLLLLLLPFLVGCNNNPTDDVTNTDSNPASDVENTDNNPTGDVENTDNDPNVFLHGEGAPDDSLGVNYQHYLDTATNFVYEKWNGKWNNRRVIGNSDLYKTETTEVRSKRSLSADNNIIVKNAIINTFYSSNISYSVNWIDKDTDLQLPYTGTGEYKIADEFIIEEFYNFLAKSDGNSDYIYLDNQWIALDANNIDHSIYYSFLPIPSIENLLYDNMCFYDDTYGQQTALIVSNLSKCEVNNGVYTIKDIPFTFTNLSTHYTEHPYSGGGKFSVKFTLGENQENLDEFCIYIDYSDTSEIYRGENCSFKYKFKDFRTTVIDAPEFVLPN